jgi:gamma-glutamylputrescine oxidase
MNLLYANDRKGEYPPSYYAATATPMDPFPVLQGAQTADVCVVGGGYMGLSAALHLAGAGHDVVLIEAHRVGFGASGRNGGQVGSGQRRDQDDLERMVGREDARRLWDLAEDAKSLVRDLITRHNMPVTFRPGVAHACWTDAEVRHDQTYAARLARDYGYTQIDPLDTPAIRHLIGSAAFKGGSIDRGAGHIHPLNFALGLAKAAQSAGVRIFEMTEALQIRPGAKPVVQTTSGTVACNHVILAGNGYMAGLAPKYSAKVMPPNPSATGPKISSPNPSPSPIPNSSSTTGVFRMTTACCSAVPKAMATAFPTSSRRSPSRCSGFIPRCGM